MEAPIYLKGQSRKGPTFREAVLMHAVARLALDPVFSNIQASWVKMGPDGAALLLDAGCNDLGGVLMNESITRAAGAMHGQEMCAADLERLIRQQGRTPAPALHALRVRAGRAHERSQRCRRRRSARLPSRSNSEGDRQLQAPGGLVDGGLPSPALPGSPPASAHPG